MYHDVSPIGSEVRRRLRLHAGQANIPQLETARANMLRHRAQLARKRGAYCGLMPPKPIYHDIGPRWLGSALFTSP